MAAPPDNPAGEGTSAQGEAVVASASSRWQMPRSCALAPSPNMGSSGLSGTLAPGYQEWLAIGK